MLKLKLTLRIRNRSESKPTSIFLRENTTSSLTHKRLLIMVDLKQQIRLIRLNLMVSRRHSDKLKQQRIPTKPKKIASRLKSPD